MDDHRRSIMVGSMLLSFSSFRHLGAPAAVLWALATFASSQLVLSDVNAQVVFSDQFDVSGGRLDRSIWTTEFGPSSFLGRTQLRDWVSDAGVGRFPVSGGNAFLSLDTFNPTGFSLYGSHAKSFMSFQPNASTDFELAVRMRLTSVQPGIVYGIYFYGYNPPSCATHDELDIEVVTNFFKPGSPFRVQLNRYASEPFGAGHGPIVNLPANFDPLAFHEWKIRWGMSKVTYLLDGAEIFSATSFIPQGPMQANIIAWGPAPEWPDAYDPSLQPVNNPGANQTFTALVDYLTVTAIAKKHASVRIDFDGDGKTDVGVY